MADLKKRIARRCAMEFKDGDFINLGIGLPTQVANYLPEGVTVTLHSENGFAGLDAMAEEGKEDVDIVNSGGMYASVVDHVCYFDSAVSFGLVRGGHVEATVLGAMEVAENGDLANWIIPGKKVAGMGGAMDLVTGAKRVIILMLHTQKGAPKLLKKCSLPLTAPSCVDMIITEMGMLKVTDHGLKLMELYPEYTVEDVLKATDCDLIINHDLTPLIPDEE